MTSLKGQGRVSMTRGFNLPRSKKSISNFKSMSEATTTTTPTNSRNPTSTPSWLPELRRINFSAQIRVLTTSSRGLRWNDRKATRASTPPCWIRAHPAGVWAVSTARDAPRVVRKGLYLIKASQWALTPWRSQLYKTRWPTREKLATFKFNLLSKSSRLKELWPSRFTFSKRILSKLANKKNWQGTKIYTCSKRFQT